jgi:hypothetical protein
MPQIHDDKSVGIDQLDRVDECVRFKIQSFHSHTYPYSTCSMFLFSKNTPYSNRYRSTPLAYKGKLLASISDSHKSLSQDYSILTFWILAEWILGL